MNKNKIPHDWVRTSPGRYDDVYTCAKCGAYHRHEFSRAFPEEPPRYGCIKKDGNSKAN